MKLSLPCIAIFLHAHSSSLVAAFLPIQNGNPLVSQKGSSVGNITPRSIIQLQMSDKKQMPDIQMPDIDIPKPDFSRVSEAIEKFDVSTVVSNLSSTDNGSVGSRGEIYFFAQAFLILSILLGGIPVIGDTLAQSILGPGLLLGGAGVAFLSVVDLGSDSLSPFPKPTSTSTLKTTGIYAEMRHPMYAGLLSLMLGLSLCTNSAARLVLSGVLLYLIDVKSDKEEEFLMEEFSDYEAYQKSVPSKFFPTTIAKKLPWNNE